ncbi:hypothetical protein ACFWPQ_34130 [Streptomyces sp. NPDC058464]|uniref:hypothetical protein n=1 Tax=Streptomyces sp. NPDC058464 TaxID=3346511 RepID=UPI00365CAFA3
MRRRLSRTLLLSGLLSASLALGAAPSFALMNPGDAGISDADWDRVMEIGDYNNALMEYVDDAGEATLVFTGSQVPDELQYPSDFTGFDNPDLVLYGEYSQFSTNDEVSTISDDTVAQISDAGYSGTATYNEDTDVIDVATDAPSSVTDPLIATYGSKINVIAAAITNESAPGGKTHKSPKKHTPKKKAAAKKHAAKKPTLKKPSAMKPSTTPAPTPQEPTKVVLKLAAH